MHERISRAEAQKQSLQLNNQPDAIPVPMFHTTRATAVRVVEHLLYHDKRLVDATL